MLKILKILKIKYWLIKNSIIKYKINDDLTVDVDGSVFLGLKNLVNLPVQFGRVAGNFVCSENKLISLKGCPREVLGHFRCSHNKLISLKYSPEIIHHEFDCSHNELTSLIEGPIKVGGNYFCFNNKLIILNGVPSEIKGTFGCSNNNLTSLAHGPHRVGGDYICTFNPIKDMGGFIPKVGDSFVHEGVTKIKEFKFLYSKDRLVLASSVINSFLFSAKLTKKLAENDKFTKIIKI